MNENVKLLRQIQDGCVSTGTSVSELLRRCQILAARVPLPELADWVRFELNGYPLEAQLPDYRIIHGTARGHFLGAFGSGLRNAVLPASVLPKEYRDWGRTARMRQTIGTMEQVANNPKKSATVSCPWPGDLIVQVQDKYFEGMALHQAWLELPTAAFIEAVESVRNRIQSFALEAEKVMNSSDEHEPLGNPRELSNVFHTHIYGTVGNLAQGNTTVSQVATIAVNDLAGLVAELRRIGVPSDDIQQLEVAIQEDGPPKDKKLGAKVTAWIGGVLSKAVAGTWNVALSTATTVLPRLLEQYYNIPL